jgi:poly(3-hydroxybutyrate) depolymerase/streptogramin lyase
VFWLHVPSHYDPAHLAPLVLAFPGGGGTGLGIERASGLSGLADRRGFLAAYPQGLAQDHGKGPVGWDASGPADPQAHGIDDGLYVSDVLNAVQAGYCVDPRRIAATGLSNGGSMTGYLACVLAGRIAVFAPVEGEFFQIPGGCHPARPASILDVHVLTDPVAPYAGVPSRASPDYYALSVPSWLRSWAARDRCQSGPRLSAQQPGVTVTSWSGCPGGAAVTGYRLASGGHSWFKSIGSLAGDKLIVGFLAARPLTRPVRRWAPGPPPSAPPLNVPRIAAASVRVFRVPTPNAEPFGVAPGPGGTIWFTEFAAGKIGRISPSGKITEYRVPAAGSGPYQIAAGAGGTMWFTEYNAAKIGRVTPGGKVSEISLPRPSFGGTGITSGPDEAVWVADPAGAADQITMTGRVTRTALPAADGSGFAATSTVARTVYLNQVTGYFEHSRVVLRIHLRQRPVPALTLPSRLANIDALATGPDGALWFTDYGTSQIGELPPGGKPRLFPDPASYAGLSDITRGPDGAMWYTEQAGLIGRITVRGVITQLALPGAGTNPNGIAAGPRRTLWVTETGTGTIVRITLPARKTGPPLGSRS